MNWNTWLRFKMRAIFEYSVRARPVPDAGPVPDARRAAQRGTARASSTHSTPLQVRAHWSELQGMAWYV